MVGQTYTGLSKQNRALSVKQVLESSDAAAPTDELRGVHRLVWDVDTREPLVCLTFDDGPDPRWTPKVLDALDKAGAKATFFMMGWNVHHHADLGKEIVAAGHDVGNHTWSHQDLSFQDAPSARQEIVDAKVALHEVLGSTSSYFRPPRGELSGSSARIAAEEGYDTFLWSVSRNDPGVGTPREVAQHIVERLRPGAIVNVHDSIGRGLFIDQNLPIVKLLKQKRDVDVASIPEVLERGMQAGLRFVTISELLAAAVHPGAMTSSAPTPTAGPTTVPPRSS